MSIQFERFTNSHLNLWNKYITRGPDYFWTLSREYLDSQTDKDYSLIIYNDTKPIGILPATCIDNVLTSHSHMTYGGLLLDESIHSEQVIEIFQALLKEFGTIYYHPIPSVLCNRKWEEDLWALHQLGFKPYKKELYGIISKSDIFSKRKQRNLNKSEGLIRIDKLNIRDYWNNILIPNLKIKYNKNPTHSLDNILQLKDQFPDRISTLGAYRDQDLIAGILFYKYNGRINHVQYIAANEVGQKLCATDRLLCDLSYCSSIVSLGTSMDNLKELNTGLHEFKYSWNHSSITVDKYVI